MRLGRLLLAGTAALAATVACIRGGGSAEMFPPEAGEWKAALPDARYDSATLHEAIDGAAEVYRALRVRSVVERRYVAPGGAEILADAFEMGSSSDAFGAYHHDVRDGEPAGLGLESEIAGAAVAFWKGRYFVSVVAVDDSPAAREAAVRIARHAADAVSDEGGPPDLLELAPGRLSWVRFFRRSESLSRYLDLSGLDDGNPLGLDDSTEGIVAGIAAAGAAGAERRPVLLAVRYPSVPRAEAALPALGRLVDDRPGVVGEKARLGRVLVAVLDAATIDAARRMIGDAETRATNVAGTRD